MALNLDHQKVQLTMSELRTLAIRARQSGKEGDMISLLLDCVEELLREIRQYDQELQRIKGGGSIVADRCSRDIQV